MYELVFRAQRSDSFYVCVCVYIYMMYVGIFYLRVCIYIYVIHICTYMYMAMSQNPVPEDPRQQPSVTEA